MIPSMKKLANLFLLIPIIFFYQSSFSQTKPRSVSDREWGVYLEFISLRSNPSDFARDEVDDYKRKYIRPKINPQDSLSKGEQKRYTKIIHRLSRQLKKIDAVNKKGLRKNARLKAIDYDTNLQRGAENWAKTLSTNKIHKHKRPLPSGVIELLSVRHEDVESNFVHLLIDAGLENWIKFRGHRRALLSYKIDGVAIAEAKPYITEKGNKKVYVFVFRMSIANKNQIRRNRSYGKG